MVVENIEEFMRDELQGCVDEFERNLKHNIRYQKVWAKLRWESYKAHVDEGFSPEQAFALVYRMDS